MSFYKSREDFFMEIMLTVGLEGPTALAGNGLVPMFWNTGVETAIVPFSIRY